MKIVIGHPFGSPNVYQAALAFQEREALLEFHTCLFRSIGKHQRSLPELNSAYIKVHPGKELLRIALTRLPIGSLSGRKQSCVDWVVRDFDGRVAQCFDKRCQVVYCYEDSALVTFRMAKRCGVRRVYELPIGYHDEARVVARQEVERDKSLLPFWVCLHESPEKLDRKSAEIAAADHIICASTYCRNTVLKHLKEPCQISVVPYGCDVQWQPKVWGSRDMRGPLKLVFVGRLDPRKGLHYLFEGLEKLIPGSFELRLAGRWVHGYKEWLMRRRRVAFRDLGQIGRGHLISVLQDSHLLVFPSLFEGFGLVLLEAMACGIPILATDRTGAPDIIEDGKEGFLVRGACSDDIVKVLNLVLDNRKLLPDMGVAARKTAVSLSWSTYRRRLATTVFEELR